MVRRLGGGAVYLMSADQNNLYFHSPPGRRQGGMSVRKPGGQQQTADSTGINSATPWHVECLMSADRGRAIRRFFPRHLN